MTTFAVPTVKDPIILADWLELQTLGANDGNASSGDLERALRRSGLYATPEEGEARTENEAVEEFTRSVFAELEQRSESAGPAYPFGVDAERGVITRVDATPARGVYVFLLCLSYLEWSDPEGALFFPRRHFENISCVAVRNYIDGRVARFAAPRDNVPATLAAAIIEMPPGFRDAVNRICAILQEGGGYRDQPTLHSQDDKLDIVAWKPFSDGLPGELLVFGQCASGRLDWRNKANELQPGLFCEDWMDHIPATRLTKAFFIPHRPTRELWERACRHGGIFFERCRLAYWATRNDLDWGPMQVWVDEVMTQNAEA